MISNKQFSICIFFKIKNEVIQVCIIITNTNIGALYVFPQFY